MAKQQANTMQKERRASMQHATDETVTLTQSALDFFHDYAREKPEVVALWAFGVGFVLGWKIKPW